jgi:hypothetical protein
MVLIISDFSSLPDITVAGTGAPLVASKVPFLPTLLVYCMGIKPLLALITKTKLVALLSTYLRY